MVDPVIEWYESTGAATPLSSHDYGTVDAGAESAIKTFFVYNNKGGTGASTATDVKYTTFDDANGGETEDVVTEKWLQVEIKSDNGTAVTDPDGGFKAVGGSTDANKKDLSTWDIENDTYLEIDTKVVVPADPDAGQRNFVQRVEYKFT